jgi:sugar/nucleoside kinase (ribokinase family)
MEVRRDVDVLVVGDLLTDVVVRPQAERAPGSDTPSQIIERRGGQGANQAAWLAAEGVPVGLVARVAAADVDRRAAELRAAAIMPFLIADADRESGRIVVFVDPQAGERDMYSDRGAAGALSPADLDEGLQSSRRWVHLSGYAAFGQEGMAVFTAAIRGARHRGLGVSVDPASTAELARFGPDRFLRLIDGIDLLLPNLAEARLLAGRDSATETIPRLLRSAAEVAVTCGARGAVAGRADGEVIEAPALPAEVVDTTGAGDAFTAGYLAARITGAATQQCLERAVAAARRAVVDLGAQPPF